MEALPFAGTRSAVDAVESLHALVLGWERSPRWISLEGGGDEVLRLPVPAALVRTAGRWFLLETGLPPAFEEPSVAAAIYDDPVELRRGPDGEDPVAAALAGVGLGIGDVGAVAVSHLHVDHAGGLDAFRHGPPVFVQRRELSFALGVAGPEQAYWRPSYDRPGLRWRKLAGDTRLGPGLYALATPGHTPGHMSYVVRRRDAPPVVLAVDAIDLREGVERDTPIGFSADPADAALRRRSHDRLTALAAREAAVLVPGHDPEVWGGPEAPF